MRPLPTVRAIAPERYITFKASIGQELEAPLSWPRPGYLLVILSALCFAAGGNVVKLLFRQGYSPLVLSQLRLWWAFAWLLAGLAVLRPSLLRVPRRELGALAVFGGVGLAGVQLTYYLAIARINIALALLVQYLGLVAIAAVERFQRRQQVSGQVWVALVMVLVGAFLAVGAYRPSLLRVNLPGIALGLVSAGFFAFYMLRASTLARRLSTWTILVYGFGTGSLLWLSFDLLTQSAPPTDWGIWAVMALVGLIGTLVGHALFVLAVRTIRPSTAGIVATAEPVFAGIIAFLVLGDRLEPLQLVGAAIVIAGIVTVQLGTREPAFAEPALS